MPRPALSPGEFADLLGKRCGMVLSGRGNWGTPEACPVPRGLGVQWHGLKQLRAFPAVPGAAGADWHNLVWLEDLLVIPRAADGDCRGFRQLRVLLAILGSTEAG
uniref:Uncharacterized protein n=1 Tax=Sphaerodactylus townsendi TaxID=933632 RepID=A0ACB8FRA1_9SAUR